MEASDMESVRLDIHGARLTITGPTRVRSTVETLYAPFISETGDAVGVRLDVVTDEAARPRLDDVDTGGRRIDGPMGPCLLHLHPPDRSVSFAGRGVLTVVEAGPSTLWLLDPEDPVVEFMLSFSISELIKSQGVYAMHAGAVAWAGAGVLIPGGSGFGKSTTTAALVQGGFELLSDDQPFVRWQAGAPELLAFPAPLKLGPESVERLAGRVPTADGSSASKRPVDVGPDLGGRQAHRARPRVLLILTLTHGLQSSLEPAQKTAAFEALLAHSLFAFDPRLTRRQFELLGSVVRAADAYHLRVGRDPRDVAALLKAAIAP
ncbi:MAG: hypothetical protein RMA76_22880 [Deltaproteobacteria bacterium]|jgi:hypothetical protein